MGRRLRARTGREYWSLLTQVAGNERTAAQLGPITRWAYLDAQARVETLAHTKAASDPLLLDASEWQRMELGELIHRAMAHWLGELARNHPTRVPRPSAQSLFPRFWPAISAANDAARRWPHRFQDLADRAVWAALLLIEPRLGDGRVVCDLLDPTEREGVPAEPLRTLHAQIQARFADTAATVS